MGASAQSLSALEWHDLLAAFPCEVTEQPAYAVTDLEGRPVDMTGAPTLQDRADAVRAARAARRAAFVHPAAANDDGEGDVLKLDWPAWLTRRRSSRVGKTENFRPRSSDARDRRSRDRTARYYREELAARASRFICNPPPPITTPDHHPDALNDNPKSKTKATLRREKQDARDTRAPADWKRTKDTGKFTAYNRTLSLGDFGTPRSFTLNIAPDIIARGLASSHSGFASFMQKRAHREIVAAVGRPLPFAFAVDVTPSGRPHLHGIVAANDDELPAVEAALPRAAGRWKAARSDKQTHIGVLWHTDGWTRYGERNLAASRRVVGPCVIAGTGSLKAAARDLHNRLRAKVIAAS